MKKLVMFFLAFSFGVECVGQFSPGKQIIYGTPRSDGYSFVKKGALWDSHPEAKVIYEGGHVEGFSDLVLEADAFGRFIDTEHNSKDNNYILIPKGEIIYWDTKIGQPRSAKCANALEFVGYVTDITVKPLDEKPVSKPADVASREIDYTKSVIVKSDKASVNQGATGVKTETTVTKTWFSRNWGWVAGTLGTSALITAGGIYLHNQNGSRVTNSGNDATTDDNGGGSRVTNTGHQ